jgi:hypothetical protein
MEVIVADQSPDTTLAAALQPWLESDARLHYLHTDVRGKTRAQNLAINGSDAELFAFTDDDCLVPPDWVARIVDTFHRHPDAGLLFGEVHAPARHDHSCCFVPTFRIAREQRLRPTFLPRAANVFGANMAVRRQTFDCVGLFDETLGPGGSLAEADEEGEFCLRVMRARPPMGVYLTPAFHVVHEYGSRPHGEATRRLLRTYEKGKAAMLAKHARQGDLGAACKLALLAFEPVMNGITGLIRTGKPQGIGMLGPYVAGVVRGLRPRGPAPTSARLRPIPGRLHSSWRANRRHVHLRLGLAHLLAGLLPHDMFNLRRSAIYRAAGVRLGRETQILGRLTLLGGTNVPGCLEVGDEAALDCPCMIDLAAPVRIGHRVNIGRETLILTGTHEIGALTRRCGPNRAEPVAIGDGTWVGARVTILPGVTIGAGCVVAAGEQCGGRQSRTRRRPCG